jgi:hypothetical protein
MYRTLRSFQFELVANLVFSATIASLSYLIYYIPASEKHPQRYNDETLCQMQSFIMIWFETSTCTWAALIGLSVYQSVIYFEENRNKTNWSKRIKFLLAGYILPMIISLIGLLLNYNGVSGRWCWVYDNNIGDEIYASILYWIQWLLILTNFILNYRVVVFLDKEMHSREERELVKKYMWKLIRYPIIQAICLFPGSINRFLRIFLGIDYEVLSILHLIFVILQGFFYAIAYGYNPQVGNALYETFLSCYCCRVASRTQSESSLKSRHSSLNHSDERLLRTNDASNSL